MNKETLAFGNKIRLTWELLLGHSEFDMIMRGLDVGKPQGEIIIRLKENDMSVLMASAVFNELKNFNFYFTINFQKTIIDDIEYTSIKYFIDTDKKNYYIKIPDNTDKYQFYQDNKFYYTMSEDSYDNNKKYIVQSFYELFKTKKNYSMEHTDTGIKIKIDLFNNGMDVIPTILNTIYDKKYLISYDIGKEYNNFNVGNENNNITLKIDMTIINKTI